MWDSTGATKATQLGNLAQAKLLHIRDKKLCPFGLFLILHCNLAGSAKALGLCKLSMSTRASCNQSPGWRCLHLNLIVLEKQQSAVAASRGLWEGALF
jgi:hypothetical protein